MDCDCIIPFFNEKEKPLYTIMSLLSKPIFEKIVVVDDGSKDNSTYKKIRAKFPQTDDYSI